MSLSTVTGLFCMSHSLQNIRDALKSPNTTTIQLTFENHTRSVAHTMELFCMSLSTLTGLFCTVTGLFCMSHSLQPTQDILSAPKELTFEHLTRRVAKVLAFVVGSEYVAVVSRFLLYFSFHSVIFLSWVSLRVFFVGLFCMFLLHVSFVLLFPPKDIFVGLFTLMKVFFFG